MNIILKKQLLARKFSSIKYMEEFRDYFSKAIDGLKESMEWFNHHHPKDVDWDKWHISEKPEGWKERALPNFERMPGSADEGIAEARKGNIGIIRGLTGSMQGLSKDMDVLGEKWWDYVDLDIARKFGINLEEPQQHASNIYRTIGGGFDYRPDTILNEEITGPIDEKDLLRYLQPNEKP